MSATKTSEQYGVIQIHEGDGCRYKNIEVKEHWIDLQSHHFDYKVVKLVSRCPNDPKVDPWEEVKVNWRLTMKRSNITSVGYYYDPFNEVFNLTMEFIGTATSTTIELYYSKGADGLPLYEKLRNYWLGYVAF